MILIHNLLAGFKYSQRSYCFGLNPLKSPVSPFEMASIFFMVFQRWLMKILKRMEIISIENGFPKAFFKFSDF